MRTEVWIYVIQAPDGLIERSVLIANRVPTPQGKYEKQKKMVKINSRQGINKYREFKNFGKALGKLRKIENIFRQVKTKKIKLENTGNCTFKSIGKADCSQLVH